MTANNIDNIIPNNNFLVQKVGSGTTVTSSIIQTSNTASATAKELISVAGGTASDPFINYAVDAVTNWSKGIDNSDSDAYVIASSTALGTTNTARSTTGGTWTYPLQPAVQAYFPAPIANVTGDGTAYTMIFGATVKNTGSNYNTGTGIFTAPKSGTYIFCGAVQVSNLGAGHTSGNIAVVSTLATLSTDFVNWGPIRDTATLNRTTLGFSNLVKMTAGDTASMVLTISGSTKTAAVNGADLGIYLLG